MDELFVYTFFRTDGIEHKAKPPAWSIKPKPSNNVSSELKTWLQSRIILSWPHKSSSRHNYVVFGLIGDSQSVSKSASAEFRSQEALSNSYLSLVRRNRSSLVSSELTMNEFKVLQLDIEWRNGNDRVFYYQRWGSHRPRFVGPPDCHLRSPWEL